MRPGSKFLLVLLLGAGGWGVYSYASRTDTLDYMTDWSEALQRAKASRKPILLNFGGPW